jgi:hypothetical protein
MKIKDMESGPPYLDIGAQTAALLAPLRSYVVVLDRPQWEPAEQQVAVCSTIEPAIFTEAKIEAKFCGNKLRLIFRAFFVNA